MLLTSYSKDAFETSARPVQSPMHLAQKQAGLLALSVGCLLLVVALYFVFGANVSVLTKVLASVASLMVALLVAAMTEGLAYAPLLRSAHANDNPQ